MEGDERKGKPDNNNVLLELIQIKAKNDGVKKKKMSLPSRWLAFGSHCFLIRFTLHNNANYHAPETLMRRWVMDVATRPGK